SVRRSGGRFVCRFLRDAGSVLRVVDDEGDVEREVELPAPGTVGAIAGEDAATEAFLEFESFARPPAVLRLDVETGGLEPFFAPAVPFDPDRFVTEQVFFRSRDGTRVPMFVTRRADVTPDGARPVHLYGYGGFYAAQTPAYSPVMLEWMERGGVYALANVRGGGEYGIVWHWEGMRERKQNVFDDFVAAAERLVEDGWTTPRRLSIGGRSNGGLLVGACLTQRPDLFGACVARVGLFDMLRYDRFPMGRTWRNEYGSSEDETQFEALRRYSPLHRVRAGATYPATLLTTADHDERVPPSHSFKFAAALQEAQAGEAPILLRVTSRAGHGAGTSTSRAIAEWVDVAAFLAEALDFPLE
ncbi:MAG: prolyl oligopeptidase family serine peptidase, partial [Planctomycetota bacterium JB042]